MPRYRVTATQEVFDVIYFDEEKTPDEVKEHYLNEEWDRLESTSTGDVCYVYSIEELPD